MQFQVQGFLALVLDSREIVWTWPSLMSGQPTLNLVKLAIVGKTATATNKTTSEPSLLALALSPGIRTVNPGFYSPGIEVYSVSLQYTLSSGLYVEVNYVQVSGSETFAYLRARFSCVLALKSKILLKLDPRES